jgi:ribosomal protein S18 acetylase RimI-like enzyme
MSTDNAAGQRKLNGNNKTGDVPELPFHEEENGNKKRPEIEIREMEVDDIPAVFHLGEKVFTADKTPTLYRTWDEFEVVSMFNSDNDYCLVAEMEGQIVGFALGNVVSKRKSAWKYGYLVWLVAEPEFQRMGIASRLFNRFSDKMIEEGVRIFMIDTEADNLPALSFFRAKGFGSPQPHIYMTFNPAATEQQKDKKRSTRGRKNGNDHRRND